MLMWEDGFCRPRVAECLEDMDGEDPVRKAFSKMSIQLYNYGEGWVLGRCSRVQFFFPGRRRRTQQQLPPVMSPSLVATTVYLALVSPADFRASSCHVPCSSTRTPNSSFISHSILA
jgi:hypothetical protein